MLIISGLGNIGREYEKTVHNAGFTAIDNLADKLNVRFDKKGCSALYTVTYINGEKTVLAKPQTYMNLSGISLRELKNKFGAKNEELLVIYDDIDLPLCSIRLREKGSAGTHNGMRNIVFELSSENIKRIRIGAGKPCVESLKNYVLSPLKGEEGELFLKGCITASEAAFEYIENRDFEKLMQKYNKKSR